jgi:Flp pilus assembly pilin Flp
MLVAKRLANAVATRALRLAARAHATTVRNGEEGISFVEYVMLAAVVLLVVLAAANGFFNAIARLFQRLTGKVNGGA